MTTRADVLRAVHVLFPDGDFTSRMQRLRPHICPFELVIDAVPAGSSVLDIGCGAGLLLGLLAHLGRITSGLGVDPSANAHRSALRMRSRLAADEGERISFDRGEEEVAEGRADVVTMIDVMHHIPPRSQRAAFLRAADHVRPGGLFVYKDIGTEPLWRALANRLHDLLMARQWIHYVDDARIAEWRTEALLEQVSWSHHPQAVYEHVLGVFRKPALAA